MQHVFLLSKKSRCERDEDFIFYGNPFDRYGAVAHSATTQGDQETIELHLSKLPKSVAKVAFSVTIHAGDEHGHTISMRQTFIYGL
ncbi:TerD family protein [Paenibacillus lentus]|uniref:TerD family protein n=1 Tax=Paenibacillus lentus TaxID=1338368 RepID=UPI0036577B0B